MISRDKFYWNANKFFPLCDEKSAPYSLQWFHNNKSTYYLQLLFKLITFEYIYIYIYTERERERESGSKIMYETPSLVTGWCGNQVIYQGGDIGNTSLAPHIHVLYLDMGLMRINPTRVILLFFLQCGAALRCPKVSLIGSSWFQQTSLHWQWQFGGMVQIENVEIIYGNKSGLEGVFVTMHESTCEQEVKSPRLKAMKSNLRYNWSIDNAKHSYFSFN